MRVPIAVYILVLAMASPALATEQDDVVMRLHQTIDAWQRHDSDGLAAILAPEIVIVDNIPPYIWKGSNALADFAKAVAEDDKKNVATDSSMALDKAREVKVDGANAYVVVPAEYHEKHNGEPQSHKGVITATMQKMNEQWRIVSWSWARD